MQRVAELNDYTLNSTGDTIVEGFVELSMYHDNGQTALIIWNNHYDPYSIPTVNLAAYGIVADDVHIVLHDDGVYHNIWRDLSDLGIIENHVTPLTYGPYASRPVHAKLNAPVPRLARTLRNQPTTPTGPSSTPPHSTTRRHYDPHYPIHQPHLRRWTHHCVR